MCIWFISWFSILFLWLCLAIYVSDFLIGFWLIKQYVFSFCSVNNVLCCCVQSLSCVQFLAAPWSVACQAPLSMGFSRQEYWSGLAFPSPEDLPNPGIKPASLAPAGGFFTTSATWNKIFFFCSVNNMDSKHLVLWEVYFDSPGRLWVKSEGRSVHAYCWYA